MTPRSPRALVAVLIFVGTVVAVISSLGAPLVPAIAARSGASLTDAQWSLTVTLLVGAVATPVVGRLGDGPRRRAVVLVVLALVTAGGVLAALPLGLEWLIVGRGLQGFGLGLTPVAIATARDALTGERSRSTVAALSVTVAAGVGLGYPTAGLIAELGGRARRLLDRCRHQPPRARSRRRSCCRRPRMSPPGGSTSSGPSCSGAGLAGLLLALGEAEVWGWTSPLLWVLLGGASAGSCSAWLFWESRSSAPLVDLRLARGRVAASAHVAALLVGLSNYLLLASIPILAQAPEAEARVRHVDRGRGPDPAALLAGSVVAGRLARSLAAGPSARWCCRWRPSSRAAPSCSSSWPARSCGSCSSLMAVAGPRRGRRLRGVPGADHLRRPAARDRQRDEPQPGPALRRLRGRQCADRHRARGRHAGGRAPPGRQRLRAIAVIGFAVVPGHGGGDLAGPRPVTAPRTPSGVLTPSGAPAPSGRTRDWARARRSAPAGWTARRTR